VGQVDANPGGTIDAMLVPFALCDVFADKPFAGNPLAVFLETEEIADDLMLALAREFGWSEITFVLPGESEAPRVRIWTPEGELPFAGHPTVGTAVVLALEGRLAPGAGTLQLQIGPIAVDVEVSGANSGRATMIQEVPEFGAVVSDLGALAAALGLDEVDLSNDTPAQMVSTGLTHFMVPVRSLYALQRATPDPRLFPEVASTLGARWAYVFTVDTPGTAAAARARLLGPGKEDAATGSAAGPLGAYLVHYGLHRSGEMVIEQGIEMGRPSSLRVDVPVRSGVIDAPRVSGEVHVWGRGQRDVS
jgi:trans-2,3-dihydro-3-hydroxyanthranilate isomerase